MEQTQKYFKVSEVAKIFGIDAKTVRNLCHSRDYQHYRFAFQPVRKGNILIDLKRFEKAMEDNPPECRRYL